MLRKNDRGFTLVELMMVIVILGVLAGVAIPLISDMRANAWTSKLKASADAIATGLIMSLSSGNAFPTDAAGVKAVANIPSDVELQVGSATVPTSGHTLVIVNGSNQFTIKGYIEEKKTAGVLDAVVDNSYKY